MQTIDIVLGVFLLILFFHGFHKGIISSILGLIGLIASIYLIANYGSTTKIMIIEKFNIQDIFATILAYILIAIVIALIFRIVIFILHRIVDVFNLGTINRLLGGAFGIISGAIIIAILLMICDISPYYKEIRNFTSESKIANFIRVNSAKIQIDYPHFKAPKKAKKKNKTVQDKTEEIKKSLEEKMTETQKTVEEFIEDKTK